MFLINKKLAEKFFCYKPNFYYNNFGITKLGKGEF